MKLLTLFALAALLGAQPLKLEKSIPLPGVKGRIDHFSLDPEGRRLFVAALGNNSVEVIDLSKGVVVHSIRNLAEPQGLFYWPAGQRLYVANGSSGKVLVFDGAAYAQTRAYDFNSDPDNIRFDERQKEVFVGYGDGALGVISAPLGSQVGFTVLKSHPESFQLERNGPRVFVNLPGLGVVTVVDRRTRSITASWPLPGATQNFPLALDEPGSRLLVGCRKPAVLAVLDSKDGRPVATVPIPGDADDLFYDAARGLIYVSAGAGALAVIRRVDADHYLPLATIPTAPGARTSFFDPESKRLYVAVPARAKRGAEILVFAPSGETAR